jgi:ubiquinone/menaquinone biosynthesis C-methylase UbiE
MTTRRAPAIGVQGSGKRTGRASSPRPPTPERDKRQREGWHGWDEYAAFYDWENRQTMGRRDVRFWQEMARRYGGPVLELGCGTGRVSLPVARTGAALVGVDRSDAMLSRARRRLRRTPLSLQLVRADIRALPFASHSPFRMVMAPYGILQSLVDEADLSATLQSVARVCRPGTIFGIDLVSDVPAWDEYKRRVRIRGTRANGASITLVESVRQERERQVTIFDQEYIERRGSRQRVQKFSLTFRTLPLAEMVSRVEAAGFSVEAVLGDYDGRPWDLRADAWLIMARRLR